MLQIILALGIENFGHMVFDCAKKKFPDKVSTEDVSVINR